MRGQRSRFVEGLLAALTVACVMVLGTGAASAGTQYERDGAIPNANGGWDLPAQGTCYPDATKTTRPECLALRIAVVPNDSPTCTAGTAPNKRTWSSGVCNDLINNADQATCEAQPDRFWNSATSVCAIVLLGDDRNAVTCAAHQGTWVTAGSCIGTWVMPLRATYTPPLLISDGTGLSPGPGDQCLRCHDAETQYNGVRVRDTENFLYTGHKNMARKVTVGKPWGGPPFTCTNPLYIDEQTCEVNGEHWNPTQYPSDDSGNVFDWTGGQISVGGTPRDLTWIYGDWLAALPRAIYKQPGGITYSCDRCHTTGWTSDATLQTTKEPETSFPGISWVSGSKDNKVVLSSGVAGDPNSTKTSSWDEWGISCTRCHSSAVNNTGGSGPFSAQTGMSSHHSNLTSVDIPGSCSNSSFRDRASCEANGATWTFGGYCSDSRFTAKAACEAGPPYELGSPLGTWFTPCSNNLYGTQATCEANGGTWTSPTSSCSVAGLCNDPAYTDKASCEAVPAQWAAATDIVTCMDAGGKWTGSNPRRGQIITGLCVQCHRQENAGLPYTNGSCSLNPSTNLDQGTCVKNGGAWTDAGGGLPVTVGAYHSTVTYPSHPHGNQFLNSPHGKFTGKFSEVATAKYGSGYGSYFQFDGEAAGTGSGCTSCHDVHESVVDKTSPFPPIKEECTSCHSGTYAKSLTAIQHPSGIGTPLEEMASNPSEACITCHMPSEAHLWRVNTSGVYSTFPASARTASAAPFVKANTSPDGSFTGAVWVDLNQSCGQCHGGGNGTATTTGTTTLDGSGKLTAIINVADVTGFKIGERIRVAGAGALEYDEVGLNPGDFESYIVSVGAAQNRITVVGAPPLVVSNAAVVQNPTRNGASYKSKATLAGLAVAMHPESGRSTTPPFVTFAYTLSGLTVNVNAAAATCAGACDLYTWTWGDGTPDGSGVATSHTYATAGSKKITLTAEQSGISGGTSSKTVKVTAPDPPPTVAGTCTLNADTWTETVTDTSTDNNPLKQVTVNWGDGTAISNDTTAPFGPFTHSYLSPGTRTITHTAVDSAGQQSSTTCTATVAFFTISGTVFKSNGITVLSAATVKLTAGSVTKTVMTAANGTFSAGSLKPGTWTVNVTKTGYTFAVPAATITVGPSSSGNIINAVTP